jgi:hypothetical protein
MSPFGKHWVRGCRRNNWNVATGMDPRQSALELSPKTWLVPKHSALTPWHSSCQCHMSTIKLGAPEREKNLQLFWTYLRGQTRCKLLCVSELKFLLRAFKCYSNTKILTAENYHLRSTLRDYTAKLWLIFHSFAFDKWMQCFFQWNGILYQTVQRVWWKLLLPDILEI